MSAGDTKIHRIRQFYGGIVAGERDQRPGVATNVEELDIFTSPDYITPETIFSADGATITRGAWDFTDDGTSIYALGEDSSGTPKAQIWKRANGMSTGLGSTTWASYLTSGQNSLRDSFLKCLEWNDGTKHLYYVTGTNSLYKYGDIAGSPSESSVGSLTGVSTANGRLPTLIRQGELFIGHGKYVAKVDGSGAFTSAAFTLPAGWLVVDMCEVANNVAILCSATAQNAGVSAVFFWDATATTGFVDVVYIPTGNPQMIVNHSESIRIFCVSNSTTTTGTLRIFELLGKKPFLTHQLSNIDTDYNTPHGAFNYSVSPKTKVIVNNILYFGVANTVNSGVYALGQARDDLPVALILSRRCHTTSYANHYPICLYATGKDMLLAFYDSNSTATFRHMAMVYSTASRSSNAIYESIWLDDGNPETPKRWDRVYAVTAPLPDSTTAIAISARVDNTAAAYSQSNSFATASNTFHTAPVNFNGKALNLKVAFTSNTTSAPKLYALEVRSTEESIKQASTT